MAKNNNYKFWIIIALVGVGLWGASQGWFSGMFAGISRETITLLDTSAQQTGVECRVSFSRSVVNAGELITGTITDGKNTQCAIYYTFNNGPWTLDSIITTDAYGKYTETRTAGTATGTYIFAAICGSCVTNQFTVVVNPLPADSDGDGFTDEEEIEAGTDPNDPNDYPGVDDGNDYTCGLLYDEFCEGTCPPTHPFCLEVGVGEYNWACMCTNAQDEVHPNWKPGGSNYYEHDETPPETTTTTSTTTTTIFSCYTACRGLPVEYGQGKFMDILRIPYDCGASCVSYCSEAGGCVRWTLYGHDPTDCCCWQCGIWE